MTTLQKTVENVVTDALNEYKSNRRGTGFSYIRLVRKLASSGISRTRALEIVAAHFPAEHRAFLTAQGRGDTLPQLFPKPGPSYAEKRKLALSRGGII
jgi:hypothetical protein